MDVERDGPSRWFDDQRRTAICRVVVVAVILGCAGCLSFTSRTRVGLPKDGSTTERLPRYEVRVYGEAKRIAVSSIPEPQRGLVMEAIKDTIPGVSISGLDLRELVAAVNQRVVALTNSANGCLVASVRIPASVPSVASPSTGGASAGSGVLFIDGPKISPLDLLIACARSMGLEVGVKRGEFVLSRIHMTIEKRGDGAIVVTRTAFWPEDEKPDYVLTIDNMETKQTAVASERLGGLGPSRER